MKYETTYPSYVCALILLLMAEWCAATGKDIQANKKIVGFAEAPFLISITHKNQVKETQYLETQGIGLSFNGLDRLRQAKITSSAYETSKGIRVGDTKEKVKKYYGEPYSPLGKKLPSSQDALLYGNLLFLFDNEDVVVGFVLGEVR